MINPFGALTTVTFQYGTTSALASTAAAGTLPASGDPSKVTASLTGLTPGTVIFYRVAASNGFGGTVTGAVQSFKTTGSPPPPPPPPPTRLTTARVGNQQIQLVTPSLRDQIVAALTTLLPHGAMFASSVSSKRTRLRGSR